MAAQQDIVVLVERDIEPSEAEVEEYAEWLGVDLDFERDLLWVAREGLTARLPKGWRACAQRDNRQDIFYWHRATGKSTWEHPNDSIYKERVIAAREDRRIVVITLTLKTDGAATSIVATTLGGSEVAALEVEGSDMFRDVEGQLRRVIALEEGAVLCFVKPDASMIGFSAGAKRISEIFQ